MSAVLIYLHIPKSAGTSVRGYLINVYGEESVFWYGLDSARQEFDAGDVADVPVVGGHVTLDFFPRNFDALYAAVIRDPVERAVSYFNYCTAPLSHGSLELREQHQQQVKLWRKRGMDASSMSRSIKRCKEFRKQIENYQCRYLSRYGPDFKGVERTLGEENVVIGLFEKLRRFNDFLRLELGFSTENRVRANVGEAGYSADILSEPGVTELIRGINVEDQALYDFVSSEWNGLYVKTNIARAVKDRLIQVRLVSNSNLQVSPGSFDWSKVYLFSKGIVPRKSTSMSKLPLMIHNGSPRNIVFSKSSPRGCAIGWQFGNEAGECIEGLSGVSEVEEIIPAGESRLLLVDINVDEARMRLEDPDFIEFCIIDDGRWVREQHPLNSSWATRHAPR